MIVAFDATPVGSGLGGDETQVRAYLVGLVGAMEDSDRLCVLAQRGAALPDAVTAHRGVTIERVSRSSGTRHFVSTLPRWLSTVGADVVVTNTHAPPRTPVPVAMVVPDLSFVHLPDAYPTATRWRLRALVGWQVRRVALVLTVSDFSRRDIIDAYGIAADRVVTVSPAIDDPRAPSAEVRDRLERRGLRTPFVLALGNRHPRKNLSRAIRSWAALAHDPSRPQLVVAGADWFGGDGATAQARALEKDAVLFLGRVSDDEREVLLREASALVYPSLFEGFGLPPLEAMARGTPVVASGTTAIPEVCGDAAVLVDPTDESSITDGLHAVLTDPTRVARLVDAGYARVARYSVQATGDALVTALRRVAA